MDSRWLSLEGRGIALTVLLTGLAALVRQFALPNDAYGSAGFAPPAKDLVFPKRDRLPSTAFLLSKTTWGSRVALPPKLSARHGVVLGGSGTGKTRGYFLPNAGVPRRASLVCSDPKGELWRLTSGVHKEAWRFAPSEPEASLSFNWIPLCKDPRISETLARAVMESGQTQRTEQAWLDLETGFLASVFSHASTLSVPTPLTAFQLFTERPIEELIEELLSSESESAREQATVLKGTSERMRGSFVPVVAARMRFMRDPAVQRFTSASLEAPDLGALRRRPIALYWCLHEGDVARLRPLSSLFFSLLFEATTRMELEESPTPLVMLLDEFANVGAVPDFDTVASVARGRGVSLWLGLQALSQLEDRYGAVKARTILANLATKVALSGLDVETSEWVSRALGEATRQSSRESWHRHGLNPLFSSTTSAQSEHGRKLLTPDEVRRIGEDEALVLVANRRPMRLGRPFYREAPQTASTSALGEARSVAKETKDASQKSDEELAPPPVWPEGL